MCDSIIDFRFRENPQSGEIPKILEHCTDMFQNLVAIKSITTTKTNWGYLTNLKKPGVVISHMGFKLANKKPKLPPKK